MSSGVRIYRVRRLARWWRLTERAALRLVWGEFGSTMAARDPRNQCWIGVGYSQARIGYWVTLEQRAWEQQSPRQSWSSCDRAGDEGEERRPQPNREEAEILNHIQRAMHGILALGLEHGGVANRDELGAAVHVLQGFVVQHMLHRIAPEYWGNWFGSAGAERA